MLIYRVHLVFIILKQHLVCVYCFTRKQHRKCIDRFFQIIAQFPYTTSEMKLDYFHQKVNIQVVSQAAKQFKI